ncbi:hypothetical protein [Emticicia sp.]|uniref:hypothetical protein n=1 Tax=Emticicia sp. TaxID=1930953 RepID=UPI00375211DB
MKTLKDYEDEMLIVRAKLDKIVFSYYDFDEAVEYLINKSIFNKVKKMGEDIGKHLPEFSDWLEGVKSNKTFQRMVKNNLDEVYKSTIVSSQADYSKSCDRMFQKIISEIPEFGINEVDEFLESHLWEVVQIANTLSFVNYENGKPIIYNGKPVIYIGTQLEEQFNIVLEFLTIYFNRLLARIGAGIGEVIHNNFFNSEFSQKKLNEFFIFYSNVEFANRKIYFESKEYDIVLESIVWHTEPIFKVIDKLKLPQHYESSKVLQHNNQNSEITGEYKENPYSYIQIKRDRKGNAVSGTNQRLLLFFTYIDDSLLNYGNRNKIADWFQISLERFEKTCGENDLHKTWFKRYCNDVRVWIEQTNKPEIINKFNLDFPH